LDAPARWSRPRIACGAGAAEAFRLLCGAAMRQIESNRAGAAPGKDPEYLHQLRVGMRRLRSTLRLFRPLLERGPAGKLNRRLRKAMRRLGAARDWDVFRETLRRSGARTPLLQEADRKRPRIAMRALPPLTAPDLESDELLAPFAQRALDKLRARLLERADGIDWRKPRRRHAVRISVKRLRYACDSFRPCFPGPAARAYLEDLERLQDLLGELNDIAVARHLLGALDQDTTGIGRRLEARERRLIAALQPAWMRLRRRRAFWRARG
jgi:CHAD domain-containing protein